MAVMNESEERGHDIVSFYDSTLLSVNFTLQLLPT